MTANLKHSPPSGPPFQNRIERLKWEQPFSSPNELASYLVNRLIIRGVILTRVVYFSKQDSYLLTQFILDSHNTSKINRRKENNNVTNLDRSVAMAARPGNCHPDRALPSAHPDLHSGSCKEQRSRTQRDLEAQPLVAVYFPGSLRRHRDLPHADRLRIPGLHEVHKLLGHHDVHQAYSGLRHACAGILVQRHPARRTHDELKQQRRTWDGTLSPVLQPDDDHRRPDPAFDGARTGTIDSTLDKNLPVF